MAGFKERIKELRNEKNLTQGQLAEELGFKTYTTVSKWESGDNLPRGKELKILSEMFNVSSDYILGISDERKIKNAPITYIYNQLQSDRQNKVYNFAEYQLNEQNKMQTVKVYGKTAAGAAIEYGDPIVEEKEVTYIPNKADCALVVEGHSMEPEIKNGSIVFYTQQPMVENGEIAIVEIEGDGVTCKKVKFDYENQKIILESLNPEYKDMIFSSEEIRILGKVVK